MKLTQTSQHTWTLLVLPILERRRSFPPSVVFSSFLLRLYCHVFQPSVRAFFVVKEMFFSGFSSAVDGWWLERRLTSVCGFPILGLAENVCWSERFLVESFQDRILLSSRRCSDFFLSCLYSLLLPHAQFSFHQMFSCKICAHWGQGLSNF